MSNIKACLYDWIVRKNAGVRYEYERYVMEHTMEHYEHRLLHWKILWKLSWHYRVRKRKVPMLYWKEEKLPISTVERRANTGVKPRAAEKLPYMDGAESSLYNNKEAHYIAKDLLQYDVISFDIFDTLIFRPFARPADLFYVIGEKLGIDSFRKIRMNAETEAREEANAIKGNNEVTVYDIYRLVNVYTGLAIEEGVKTELEVERELCFANPQMKRVFDILKYQDKRLILTSDMYLPSELLKQLLDKCGISGYEKIFVSCEYQCSKRTGGLYLNILNYFGEGVSLAHIGDNHETDYVRPKEYDIVSIFYKNVNKAGNMYRADGMSELVGSAYAGIVNAHLHSGIKKYSVGYEYGFVNGGLYVFGFCNWIHKISKEQGIEKIIFLSRDGNIYKKVFDSFFGEIESEYLYWSRVANMRYCIDADHGKYYFILRAVDDRINKELQKEPITIRQLLQILQLDEIMFDLGKTGLHPDFLVTKENAKLLKMFLHRHWSDIVSIYTREEEAIKKVIFSKIGNYKKIAIVDVGWNGSGPLGIKYLIEEKWKKDCVVKCLVAGSKVADNVANINRLENEDLQAYMFSRILNRSNYDIHKDSNGGVNSSIFEIFTQACEPSFAFVKPGGDFVFELPEIENYGMINEIQKGIYDFCRIYAEEFEKYPYIYNISGHDAYCPFRMAIRNTEYIKNIAGKFILSRSVGNSMDNYGFWTVKDMLQKK